MSKKLVNEVEDVVPDLLSGMVSCNPDLALLKGHKVVLRSDLESLKGQVALVAGGGSGHEPFAGGYVGKGMLTGAVAGNVFASPPTSSILATLRTVWGQGQPSGILVILINYTGDRINFGLAIEKAKSEGIKCEFVAVADDCAITSSDKSAGRRGLAGAVLVLKIAGALSEMGKSLNEIEATLTNDVLPNLGTIGLSLSPCSLPGSATPSFHLGNDEMELGLGIHGEAGVRRLKVKSASSVIDTMINHMTDLNSATCLEVPDKSDVVVLINNLGGTSNLEMGIITNEVVKHLKKRTWKIVRIFVGKFMTSLEMAGISISILKLTNQDLISFLDLEVNALGWPRHAQFKLTSEYEAKEIVGPETSHMEVVSEAVHLSEFGQAVANKAIYFVCEALKSCEMQLNILDTGSGDGDCGSTFCRGAKELQKQLETSCENMKSVQGIFEIISSIAEVHMGGSCGAMYSLLFASAASQLNLLSTNPEIGEIVAALRSGLAAMMKYGGAVLGDRTMIDALHPALEALSEANTNPLQALEEAAKMAEEGAKSTLHMKASAGRASYVAQDELKNPDPGAHAVGIIFRAIYQAALLKCNEVGFQ